MVMKKDGWLRQNMSMLGHIRRLAAYRFEVLAFDKWHEALRNQRSLSRFHVIADHWPVMTSDML
jgi:hypothetical protein